MALNKWTRRGLRRLFDEGKDFEFACEELDIIPQDMEAARRYWNQLEECRG
jgi:hypothetical protein